MHWATFVSLKNNDSMYKLSIRTVSLPRFPTLTKKNNYMELLQAPDHIEIAVSDGAKMLGKLQVKVPT